MSNPRLYCATPLTANSTLVLDGTQAHYLGHVLRVRPDDVINLFDGSGFEFASIVLAAGRKHVELRVGTASEVTTESALQITLIQALIRGERMDFCVQKATELGVTRIVPVFTDRTVVKIPADRRQKRVTHWHKIAVSACEQSGRVRIPAVDPPETLQNAVSNMATTDTTVLLLDPWSEAIALPALPQPPSGKIAVCIGPEGGYSDEELEFLRSCGAVSVTCGPRVMRSETAGVVAVAACQMLWGDWSGQS